MFSGAKGQTQLRPTMIGNRTVAMSGVPISGTAATNRISHIAPAGGFSNVRLTYANFDNGTGGSNNNNDGSSLEGTLTVGVGVEYPSGTITPITIGGSATGSTAAGGIIRTDFGTVTVPGGATWWERVYRSSTGSIPVGAALYASLGDGQDTGGTNKSYSGTIATVGSTAQEFGAIAIEGTPLNGNIGSILVLADSLAEGIGDQTGAIQDRGWVAKLFVGHLGYCNMGISGSSYSNFFPSLNSSSTNNSLYRWPLIQQLRPTVVFCSPPGNDFFGGLYTLAQIKSHVQAVWTALSQLGCNVVAWTLPPATNSNNTWKDLAGQTGFNYGAYAGNWLTDRNDYNSWLLGINAYAGNGYPSPLSYVFDVCPYVENNSTAGNGDGYWLTTGAAGAVTTDGKHPTTAVATNIANGFAGYITQFSKFVN